MCTKIVITIDSSFKNRLLVVPLCNIGRFSLKRNPLKLCFVSVPMLNARSFLNGKEPCDWRKSGFYLGEVPEKTVWEKNQVVISNVSMCEVNMPSIHCTWVLFKYASCYIWQESSAFYLHLFKPRIAPVAYVSWGKSQVRGVGGPPVCPLQMQL